MTLFQLKIFPFKPLRIALKTENGFVTESGRSTYYRLYYVWKYNS